MEAARVAALRGHTVTLFEKEEQLGGQVLIAAKAPFRETLGEVARYLSHQVHKAGVDVRLGVTATADIVREVKPDAVGLSALLVSTSKQMQYFVEYARTNNIKIPILCGGAAINSNYINRIAKDGGTYDTGVFYCKTAFDGLKVMNSLMSDQRESFLSDWKFKLSKWKDNISYTERTKVLPRSKIAPVTPPKPPHINKIIRISQKDIDLYDVWKFLNRKSLFVLSWGIRGKSVNKLESASEALLAEWQERVVKQKLFACTAVYGYFKCHNRNSILHVEIPNNADEVSFEFPRSSLEKHLCITDYFGENDINRARIGLDCIFGVTPTMCASSSLLGDAIRRLVVTIR